jgi:hypothetical protein
MRRSGNLPASGSGNNDHQGSSGKNRADPGQGLVAAHRACDRSEGVTDGGRSGQRRRPSPSEGESHILQFDGQPTHWRLPRGTCGSWRCDAALSE